MRKDYLHIGFLILVWWFLLSLLSWMINVPEIIWYVGLEILGIIILALGLFLKESAQDKG